MFSLHTKQNIPYFFLKDDGSVPQMRDMNCSMDVCNVYTCVMIILYALILRLYILKIINREIKGWSCLVDWIDGWIDGWLIGWTGAWLARWIDRQVGGWLDGWLDA